MLSFFKDASIYCMKKYLLLLVSTMLFSANASAQFLFKKINTIEVRDTNDIKLKNPWVGGLNNPQFSSADLNNDGIEDLVIFNKTYTVNNDQVLTFIKGPNGYEHAPEYQANFPYTEVDSPKMEFFMLLKDYNCDGIADAFSCTPGYIQAYKGRYDANNKLTFDYQTFLQFNSFTGLLNVFVSSIDIPAIVDVNGDGDLDVLTFNIFGFVIEYYENQSMELTGTCGDTLVFELVDDCWGNIFEDGLRKAVQFRDTCGTLTGKGGPRHSGSAVLAFDIDADGDKDVLLGDISFTNMNMVINGGTADSARGVSQDTIFPFYNVSIDLPIFPAGFYLDVTNDGRNDLIIAPNSPKNSENYYCAWLYENTSSTAEDSFTLKTKSFMVEDMIDVGAGAYPVFVDINQDGLMDFVVGNYGYYTNGVNYKSGLAYFQNIGTTDVPAFKLIDRDLFNLSTLNFKGLAPAFGDLDGDGDLDMILGEESGELHYFTNTAGAGNLMNFTLTTPFYFRIDIGQFSMPVLFDVNDDGLLDMVVGERSGNLNYFVNKGTVDTASFSRDPDNSFFGEIDIREPGLITGFSAPAFATLDSTDKIYLLVGSESRGITVYDFDRGNANAGAFTKLFERYSDIREGEQTTIALADITNDGKLEMLVGNYKGGVSFYSQSDSIAEPPSSVANFNVNDFVVYPNPTNDKLFVRFKDIPQQEWKISMYNILGSQVYAERKEISAGTTVVIDTQLFEKGIYILELSNNGFRKTHKIVVH